ncbi:MAG: BMP family ABC transporter substrate-binding protein [Polyangia bacterium]
MQGLVSLARRGRCALLAGVLLATGCTALASTDLGRGLGESCESDSDCQRAICQFNEVTTVDRAPGLSVRTLPMRRAGICTVPCVSNADCISGTRCATGYCRPVRSVAAIFVGNANEFDGWTLAHDTGLHAAASALGYVDLNIRYGVLPGGAAPILSALPADTDIVLANGVDYESELRAAARQRPTTHFLMADNLIYGTGSSNFTPYGIYLDEGYYLAGRIAAQRATRRIGFISGFIFPQSVRLLNAFTLGARSVKPNIVVEVRHLGFFSDLNTAPTQTYTPAVGAPVLYFREQLLARLLIDSGCEVIAQYSDTQRAVQLVDALETSGAIPTGSVYTMTFGVRDSCRSGSGRLIPTCIGSVYSDWSELYRTAIDQIARGTFDPLVPLRNDIDDGDASSVGFYPNAGGRSVDVTAVLQENQNLARSTNPGPRERVFQGPYALNGQRDSDFDGIPDPPERQRIAAGETLSDTENARACFYVEGVVEKVNPDDPTSADRAALVPGGLVPGASSPGTSAPLVPGQTNRLTLPPGLPTECRKNAAPVP